MEKICELKNKYISVNGSYGGNQLYFKNEPGFFDKFKHSSGCGVVAMTDLLMYLKGQNYVSGPNEYKRIFNQNCKKLLWIPQKSGLSFIQLMLGIILQFFFQSLPYIAFWSFSRKKLYSRILSMILNNTPVILCIPRVFGKNSSSNTLPFYNEKLQKVNSTNGHFVVVTGIFKSENDSKHQKKTPEEIYLSISSWGQKYYISFSEYLSFLKKHPMGLLGNILYIKPIK